ncbi:peptidoglycan DD-metalloendopeptidase family protein [Glaciimonas sp. PAMC28666]|uniref:peptidoglycan DD-metalloendopeptidase family protein n=1 Tax=Glaciimonas sp. PAMC28666 TaxID=2807626 RepID=UPI00196344AA|nr:peptidoglycan DD-metalloendopeptidase family protein [Glaciimonas sp. PAMC28666]QRX83010.1 peptidoglycan DD-metalloendopeptidase family protein [Glaciimonas sp. PAMC28666]
MKKTRLLLLGIIVGSIAACTTTRTPAPVVDRRVGGPTVSASTNSPQQPQAPRVSGPGYYTVKKGDTLYRIALEFGQSYRDIVSWNNLNNANDIKVDQVLRVQPPEAGNNLAGGAQVGNVSSESGVEVRPLGSAASNTASSAITSGAVSAGNKTSPRGDKRPYSDGALAELQKPDAPSVPDLRSDVKPDARPEIKSEAPKNNDKAASSPAASSGEDDRIDWMWPTEGKLLGGFDQGKKGIDIAGKTGQPVLAAAAGKVMYAGSGIRGYGNLVIVKHTNNLLSAYAHNKVILVKEGQVVSKGQKIAEMGNSDSDSIKLHFEIRQQGKPVDPSKFLPSR